MRGVGFILALLTLVGCKSTDDFVGSGPIVLSKDTTRYYRESYLNRAGPHYFIVSGDGRFSSYTFCADGIGQCSGPAIVFRYIDICEQRANAPCYVFDENGQVVWNGPVRFAGDVVASPADLTPAKLGTPELCRLAIFDETYKTSWSQAFANRPYVEEAQARNLTPAACIKHWISSIDDPELCREVLVRRNDKPEWVGGGYNRLVWEAEGRGLTPKACDRLLTDS